MKRQIRLGILVSLVSGLVLWSVPVAHAARHHPGKPKASQHHSTKRSPRQVKPTATATPAVTTEAKMAALTLLNTILNDITPCSQQFHAWFDGYDVSTTGSDTEAVSYKAKTVSGLCDQALAALKVVSIPSSVYQHDLLQAVLVDEQTVAHEYASATSAIFYLASAYSDVEAGAYNEAMAVVDGIEPRLVANVNQLRATLQT